MATKKTEQLEMFEATEPEIVPIPEAVLNNLRELQLRLRAENQNLMDRIALVAGALRPGRRVRTVSLDEGAIVYDPAPAAEIKKEGDG